MTLISTDLLLKVAADLKKESAYPTNIMMTLEQFQQNHPFFLEDLDHFLEICGNNRENVRSIENVEQ